MSSSPPVFRKEWKRTSSLKSIVASMAAFTPYPRYDDRSPWQNLPADATAAIIAEAENHIGFQWPPLPATLFMDYSRTGNRQRYESLMFHRRQTLASLVLAECIQGEGRFIDDIVNGLWAVCEESFWGVPAHNYDPQHGRDPLPHPEYPIIDLFAAETGALLAWTSYLLGDRLAQVSPRITKRLKREVTHRIIEPFLNRNDFWWMGDNRRQPLNNWTPWCVSNCLAVALLVEEDTAKRQRTVGKSIIMLERYLALQPADGGCDEGVSYWGRAAASLFDCLELLREATDGQIDVYDHPLVQHMARYLYRVHISGDYYVNFGDGSAKPNVDGALTYAFGRRIGDKQMAALGAWTHRAKPLFTTRNGSLQRPLNALFNHDAITATDSRPPYVAEVHLPDLQLMTSREKEGSDRGFFIAAKGGHNAENHNHNDVGQFVVFYNGKPLFIDVGVGTYTAKTFSAERYTIWTMQSAYHNLPTVNRVQQSPGRHFRATDVHFFQTDEAVTYSMDISQAYPEQAGILSWRRSITLNRGAESHVTLKETFELTAPTDRIELSLVTPHLLQMTEDIQLLATTDVNQEILLMDGEVSIVLKGLPLQTRCTEIVLKDEQLKNVWGDRIYRIILSPVEPVTTGSWEIVMRSNRPHRKNDA